MYIYPKYINVSFRNVLFFSTNINFKNSHVRFFFVDGNKSKLIKTALEALNLRKSKLGSSQLQGNLTS